MKIEGPGRINTPSGPAKVGKAGTKPGEFSNLVEGSEETESAASIESAAPLAAVTTLIGLQEVDDATERRSRARRRATGLLDQLDEIRNGLLMGEMPMHLLTTLRERIAREKINVDDPSLIALLDEVELRAEVELAKLEQAASEAT